MTDTNGVIKSTMLGLEDHGILTAFIQCEFDGSGQGFGGFGFDQPIKDQDGNFLHREGVAWGMEFIRRVLETLDVRSWEELKGTPIRVRRVGDSWGEKIVAIGHYYKDRWFDPVEDLKHLMPKGEK
jgi:hypothetical protein